MEKNQVKLKIAYMINPDKVYYGTMDDEIIQYLEKCNSEVTKVYISDLSFRLENNIRFQNKGEDLEIDAFISYGYMSEFHLNAYEYIVFTLNQMGVVTLHEYLAEKMMNDKFLQMAAYMKNKVPIPNTDLAFNLEAYKSIVKKSYNSNCVIKKMFEYGSDGVDIFKNPHNSLNKIAKSIWKGELSLLQEFIPDSIGTSIRVLIIGGKAVACVRFVDKTGNIKSNQSYGEENFALENMMKSDKLNEYFDIAERAAKSLSNELTVGGIDILDSKKYGLVVLETNSFPDLYDTRESSGLDVFQLFTESFCNKVRTKLNKL